LAIYKPRFLFVWSVNDDLNPGGLTRRLRLRLRERAHEPGLQLDDADQSVNRRQVALDCLIPQCREHGFQPR